MSEIDSLPKSQHGLTDLRKDVGQPQAGTALCLSGGGYRAMLFHLGSLWRLYEANLLKGIDRISSVSGGSITAGMLALRWNSLSFEPSNIQKDFVPGVVEPIRRLASHSIDWPCVLYGLLVPWASVSGCIAAKYRKFLFDMATLQDLPDHPRFVINATNVQSGALWRFMKPYMRDWRVGEVKNPKVELALAVAASSAFPPVLSPTRLSLKDSDYTQGSGADLQREPFTTRVVLTDGGVYDNLGLETAYKTYTTILVSDAGGKLEAQEKPWRNWPLHAYRTLELIDNQVRSLRKRQLIDAYKQNIRQGTYWGIRSHVADYSIGAALPCPVARTMDLAATPTRLKKMADNRQKRLINWGYAICDAAIRRHINGTLPLPASFPYADAGI